MARAPFRSNISPRSMTQIGTFVDVCSYEGNGLNESVTPDL
jgi:hypothetical protein